jgi:membrane-associated PAP2 superfamily phosphatase
MKLSTLRIAVTALAALVVILAWELSGLDLPIARELGGPQGFPWRDDWLLSSVLHNGAKDLGWLLTIALCLNVTWPIGAMKRLPVSRRVQLVASALLAWAVVALLKYANHTSCPWDLDEFGGIARQISHWSGWTVYDGGAGRCFPAGHATTGFAFVGGYFALRGDLPKLARTWLTCALIAGFVLGFAQQLRGAHFMSHTLWTGWICWMTAWAVDVFFTGRAVPDGREPAQ